MLSPSERYRIEGPLGRGGMGEVYRAFDTLLSRPVALKLLRPDRNGEAIGDTTRLLREARACASLKHPNVVTIYDVGERDGTAFIAMELLEGESLRTRIGARAIPLGTKLGWLRDIASALDTAHRAGIVHRDVKPENIVVCGDGVVRLIDFGVARSDDLQPYESQTTGAVKLVGTPRYMAPEQRDGVPTPKSDQFSWAIVACELLAGIHPADQAELRAKAPDLPSDWARVIDRALSPDPVARFASMGELLDALGSSSLTLHVAQAAHGALAETHFANTSSVDELPTHDRAQAAPWIEDHVEDGAEQNPGALRPGTVLDGRYRIDGFLGKGGMGAVYSADHLELNKRVAIKMFIARATEESIGRFVQEAKVAAKLTSRHAARVLDIATPPGRQPYIVMELLEGEDLEALLARRKRLPVDEAVRAVLEACEAVAEAHQKGIIHRDLKPANLFVSRQPDGAEWIKVLDFGLSKMVRPHDEATHVSHVSLSKTYAFMGSPAYMSPEQLRNAKGVDGRTDIWALGVVLYELLTGELPFAQDNAALMLLAIASSPWIPARQRRPELPIELEAILARCMEKDPAARFPDVPSLARALAPFAVSTAVSSAVPLLRPVTPIGAGATDTAGTGTTINVAAANRRTAGLAIAGAVLVGGVVATVALYDARPQIAPAQAGTAQEPTRVSTPASNLPGPSPTPAAAAAALVTASPPPSGSAASEGAHVTPPATTTSPPPVNASATAPTATDGAGKRKPPKPPAAKPSGQPTFKPVTDRLD